MIFKMQYNCFMNNPKIFIMFFSLCDIIAAPHSLYSDVEFICCCIAWTILSSPAIQTKLLVHIAYVHLVYEVIKRWILIVVVHEIIAKIVTEQQIRKCVY